MNNILRSEEIRRCRGSAATASGIPFRQPQKGADEGLHGKFGATEIYECPVCIVESEIHMVQASRMSRTPGCNALVVYLGNFGPEISETLLPPSTLTARSQNVCRGGGGMQTI